MTKAYIFLGPPGCGKGTQTEILAKELKLPHIDTGSLLRKNIEQKTDIGMIAKKFIDKGQLVPSEVAAEVIKNRLKDKDCAKGYVLDGYPRSLEQALALDKILDELNCDIKKEDIEAFYFNISNEALIERLINRRSCPKCGKIYNLKTAPSKKGNLCDICGAELIQRKDDTKETALLRLETYDRETKPLVEFYTKRGNLKTINANQPIEKVWSELACAVGIKDKG